MISDMSYVETMLPIMPPCSSWHMITLKPVESVVQLVENGRFSELDEDCGCVMLLDEFDSTELELTWLELIGASLDELVCASLEEGTEDSA